MNYTAKSISKLLRKIADAIENGNLVLDSDEIHAVVSSFSTRKMSIEQIAQHYGVSRATIYRWIKSGKLLRPHKEPGGKEYFWLNECDEHMREHQ